MTYQVWRVAVVRMTQIFGAVLLAHIYAIMPNVVLAQSGRPPVPYIYKALHIDYDVRPDGAATETTHISLQALDGAGAGMIGQVPITYSDSLERLEILEAYTLKGNGEKIPVATGSIMSQLPPGNPKAAQFSDQKQKVILFPQVRSDDTVTWTVRRTELRPRLPGNFTFAYVLDPTGAYEDVRITIRVPPGMNLKTKSHDGNSEKSATNAKATYTWRYRNVSPPADDASVIALMDRAPRVFASSFQSYEEFGRAYAKLALPKIAVTDKVRLLAEKITAGIATREQKARTIYEWVNQNIRYVAVYLGNGGLEPHHPDQIIDNGFGDCKDHSVLFAALLKASGIKSELVLVNLGNAYTLSEAPTLGQLNHMISWLPDLRLYADTTIGLAPFGSIAFEEYGKRVVHVADDGATLREIPPLTRGVATSTTRTNAKLLVDGRLTGKTTTSATGPLAVTLRQFTLWAQSNGTIQSTQRRLQSLGNEGSGSIQARPIIALTREYTITEDFDIALGRRALTGEGLIVPIGTEPLPRPGDFLMGPLSRAGLKPEDSTPCFAGSQSEEIMIELPPGKKAAYLPKNIKIENAHLSFSSEWRTASGFVTIHRRFEARPDKPLCEGGTRVAVAEALDHIRDAYRARISLQDK